MEERSTFFVELPDTRSLRESSRAAGECLHYFVTDRIPGLVSCCISAGCAFASSLIPSSDTWHDFQDKWRSWIVGVVIALVVLLGVALTSRAVVSARFPHTQQQLQLHLHQGEPYHPSQTATSHPSSSSVTPLPILTSSSSLHGASSQAEQEALSESRTGKQGNESLGNHQGSGEHHVDNGKGDMPNGQERDSPNSILAAALESEALQLPGSSTRAELAAGRDQITGRQKSGLQLSPTVEQDQGLILMWQVPPRARAVLLLLHGCGEGPALFWPRQANCTRCVGLPEEQAIATAALRRGYALVGVRRQHSSCWDASWPQSLTMSASSSSPSDVALVSAVVSSWRRRKGLDNVPLYALGISSGGAFATVLAHAIDFKALAIYLSAGQPSALSSSKTRNTTFPPTLFVHMPRDVRTGKSVMAAVQGLRRMGMQAAQVRCRPMALSALFLSDRIPSFPVMLSQEIFGALKLRGFLDKEGYLLQNPRALSWQQVLQQDGILRHGKLESLLGRAHTGLEGSAAEGALRGAGPLHHTGTHMQPKASEKVTRGNRRQLAGAHLAANRGHNRFRRRIKGGAREFATMESHWQEVAVAQELNLAYGLHECSSEKVTETFDWFNDRCWYNGRYKHHRCSRFFTGRRSSTS